jgi:hypothetical protein
MLKRHSVGEDEMSSRQILLLSLDVQLLRKSLRSNPDVHQKLVISNARITKLFVCNHPRIQYLMPRS